jgi:hypothetical protein
MNRGSDMHLTLATWMCVACVIALTMAGRGMAAELDVHLWRERPLLLFAPSADHPERVRLVKELERRRHELDERQIVVYELLPRGAARVGDKPLGAATVEDMRRRFAVTADQAVLILIGKDGGEKLRAGLGTVDLDTVFRRVDAMPMRRLEMQGRP